MPIQKTEAVVLRSQRLGETSKLITLYTRKYGILKVVAKGARGLKSHFYGTLEPTNYITLVFYYKEERDLQLLSQADIIKSFNGIKSNLKKFSMALIICEIVIRSQYDKESNPNLFNFITEFLIRLNEAQERLENFLFWFQIEFLKINGFKPQLSGCIVCGHKNTKKNNFYFSIIRGGFICSACKTSEFTGLLISHNTVDYLYSLENSNPLDIIKIESSAEVVKESKHLLYKFMGYHIEGLKNLKSLKFFKQLRF